MFQKIKKTVETFFAWLQRGELSCSSVRVAYYMTLSIFPIIMAAGTALPIFGIEMQEFIRYLENVVPGPLMESFRPIIEGLLTPDSGRLSLSIIALVWASGKGMRALQTGLDRAYGLKKPRHFLVSAVLPVVILALLMTLVLAFIAAVSLGKGALGALLGTTENAIFNRAFDLLRWAAPFLGLFLVFAALYKIAPGVRHRSGDALAGAFFAAAAVMLMVNLFALYLRLLHPFIAGYGAGAAAAQVAGLLGSFFILMIWIKLLADVILLGAMINAAVYKRRYGDPQPRRYLLDEFLARVIKKVFSGKWFAARKKKQ